jgi:hypothetical protein
MASLPKTRAIVPLTANTSRYTWRVAGVNEYVEGKANAGGPSGWRSKVEHAFGDTRGALG